MTFAADFNAIGAALDARLADVDARSAAAAASLAALEARVAALEAVKAPAPDPISPPAPEPTAPRNIWGMSSPRAEWDLRLSQVQATGKKLGGRRLFVPGFTSVSDFLEIAKAEAAEGRKSVLSLSTDGDVEWTKFANGSYDDEIATLITKTKNAGLADKVFWVVKHEPIGDGTASIYANMQLHLAPIFKKAGIKFGPIINGYGFSNKSQAMSDAEYAAWLPDSLLPLCDFIGADIYQGGTFAEPGEMAGPRVINFSKWADRKGVSRLLIGEFNGMDAAAIKSATDAIKLDPRYIFAGVFNSSRNNREGVDWVLSGERLSAFQSVLPTA